MYLSSDSGIYYWTVDTNMLLKLDSAGYKYDPVTGFVNLAVNLVAS